jgi:Flp pilus assembly protein TadG
MVTPMNPDLLTPTRPRAAERGAALAELAMIVPIMLALLLVVFDFGQGFLAYISVSNGARDGARAAMLDDRACDDAAVEPSVRTAAQNGAAPLTPLTVNISVPATGRCQVRVTYTYTPILPFVTTSFELPFVGPVGPLWNGTLSRTMVSQ